jgi:predicted RNase H-like HicB family nuclease
MKFLVIVEQTDTGYSAYSPDLPGCIATGATQPDVEARMAAAIELHLQTIRETGDRAPTPQSYATYVEVAAA